MAKTTKTKVQFKRFLFVLFTLAILVTVTAFAASAAEVVDSGTCGENLTWTLDSDGAMTIAGTGATQDWSWDESAPWYSHSESIKSVTIPEGVTSIGDYAFGGCSSLTSVTFAGNSQLTSIGDLAFGDCSNLTSITIPEGVTSIGYGAFYYCSSLTSVTIPVGVTSIGLSTFDGCTNLTSVTFADTSQLASIGDSVFRGCTSLTIVTIPEGVTSIGETAFLNCTDLKDVYYQGDLTGWLGISFSYYSNPCCNGANLYFNGELVEAVTIPDGVASIGEFAFNGCTSLESITIPEGVTSIGDSAFEFCISLTSITIPESVTSIGEGAFANCMSLEIVTIPECVTIIGDYAFVGCIRLESVTLAGNSQLTSIGEGAFSDCLSLESVTIPEGVTSIGDGAFDSCVSLENITVPSTVTEIGDMAMGYTTVRLVGSVSEYIEAYSAIISALMNGSSDLISDAMARMGEIAEELDSPVLIDGFTVTGYENTAAQTYATENNITFIKKTVCQHETYTSKQAKAASCTEDGFTAEVKCSVCNEIITASEVITALGHSYGEWSVTREANVASVGEKQRRCSVCNDVESEEIAKLDGITVNDDETEFAASYGEGTFEDDVVMTTEQIFDGTVYQALDRKYGKCEVFDISFKQNGTVVQPDGTVWISFPLPEGYDADYTAVYYINEAGESVKMNSYCYNSYIYFEATHFSIYSIVDESSLVNEQQEEIMEYERILSFFIRLLELVFKFVALVTG